VRAICGVTHLVEPAERRHRAHRCRGEARAARLPTPRRTRERKVRVGFSALTHEAGSFFRSCAVPTTSCTARRSASFLAGFYTYRVRSPVRLIPFSFSLGSQGRPLITPKASSSRTRESQSSFSGSLSHWPRLQHRVTVPRSTQWAGQMSRYAP